MQSTGITSEEGPSVNAFYATGVTRQGVTTGLASSCHALVVPWRNWRSNKIARRTSMPRRHVGVGVYRSDEQPPRLIDVIGNGAYWARRDLDSRTGQRLRGRRFGLYDTYQAVLARCKV